MDHHDFQKQLQWSERAGHEPFWEAVYRKAFPNLVNLMPAGGDYESQRQGVDRVLLLSSGQVLKVDEKKRLERWPDILLEYVSVDRTNKPGWMECEKQIDYVAYAFMPDRRVYLLPWHLLRRAWIVHGEQWKQWGEDKVNGFRTVKAKNDGYFTWSVAVPIEKLYAAVNRASVIEVSLADVREYGSFDECG